jgi:carbohydrate diacid regulator
LKVPKGLAQNIVEEMKIIINQDVNYFNKDAIIIASTDKDRIGNYHGGAKKVLTEKTNLLIRYDDEFEGAKKGINVPIYFMNEVVGVIGITGDKAEVEKYGLIIQRMTEILIKEAYLKEQENIHTESIRKYLEELLFSRKTDDNDLKIRGDLLGVDTSIPRIVVLSKVFNDEDKELVSPAINEKILRSYKKHISNDENNLILQSGTNIILVLRMLSNKGIELLLNSIARDVKSKFDVSIYFSVGNSSNNPSSIKRSYKEAKKAMDMNIAFRKEEIIYYSRLDLGLIINDVSENVSREYMGKVFRNMNSDEIEDYQELLQTFVKNNGSIKKTSEEYYIHKNTLQYRLNKLKDLTGHDPRTIEGIVVLYIAFLIYKINK